MAISVIIPTRNRPGSVVRAVQSALGQSHPPHEVVVIVDGPDAETVRCLDDIGDPRLVVLELAVNGGAARARNVGVATSTGEWVAFLDDDDEWLPDKLRAQSIFANSGVAAEHLVLATGVERKGDNTSDLWPLRSPAPNEQVGDYLFVRRHPGEGLLQTSTIMLRRDFAMAIPFPEHLRIHEDYDWFIRLDAAGAHFTVILQPMVVFNAPSQRLSLSTGVQWDTSLAWALTRRRDMSSRAFTDFCLTEVARAAKSTGGFRAEFAVFCAACTGRLSWFSTGRFLAICFLPGDLRRRLAAKSPMGLMKGRTVNR